MREVDTRKVCCQHRWQASAARWCRKAAKLQHIRCMWMCCIVMNSVGSDPSSDHSQREAHVHFLRTAATLIFFYDSTYINMSMPCWFFPLIFHASVFWNTCIHTQSTNLVETIFDKQQQHHCLYAHPTSHIIISKADSNSNGFFRPMEHWYIKTSWNFIAIVNHYR